eukprot:g916.t1
MSTKGIRKLNQEIRKYVQSPIDGVRLIPSLTTSTECCFELDGPEKTPYEDGVFKLKLVFDDDYPTNPPKGHFLTRIFHPNISTTGDVCVNVLSRDWSPDLGLSHILMVIRCLLIQPFAESALDEVAGMMLLRSYDEYFQRAKLFTSIHAKRVNKRSADDRPLTLVVSNKRLVESKDKDENKEEEEEEFRDQYKLQKSTKLRTGLRRL